jgi:hypothetical protein
MKNSLQERARFRGAEKQVTTNLPITRRGFSLILEPNQTSDPPPDSDSQSGITASRTSAPTLALR